MILLLTKIFFNVKIFLNDNSSSYPEKEILKWRGDYIFSFRSHYILRQNLIDRAKIAAINFHPGPPEYRGIGCVNFAILNQEIKYGCTAHIIDKKIDNGQIIAVKRFRILKNDTIDSILHKTYHYQYNQFLKILKNIKKNKDAKIAFKKINENWSKTIYTRKKMLKLYNISKNISKSFFLLLLRATNTSKFKPYIKFHNKYFYFND